MGGFHVNWDTDGVFCLYIANIWVQQLKVVETPAWESPEPSRVQVE